MLHTILGLIGAAALLATCIAGEHVRNRLAASGLLQGRDLIAD